jgi:pimeloyl-ACP methyl ester carboxylesterase
MWKRILIGLVLVLLFLVLAGPFLVPIPALEDTVPPRDLADADSLFVEVDGLEVHYKQVGAPPGEGQRAFLLLHGFAASTFSWREVMAPLAEGGATAVAFDRPAFGLTERPMPGEWQGASPYRPEAQAALTVGLMDELGIDGAVLVGNSAGGTVALLTALLYPERVEALVLVDAAIYSGGGAPRWIRPLLRTPQARRLGPLAARAIRDWGYEFGRSAWHDPSRLTPEIWEAYTRPLRAENWDRALWELTVASDYPDLPSRLGELQMPVLVVTGDDDRIVPTEQSVRLAGEIPGAALAVLPACGHVPQEECPEAFLAVVKGFLGR